VEHPAERLVMHVDMDCFFAAVEEREDTSLKGKPVVVGSDPQGGRGRGIVATCNYEARKFGLRSALPISIAWRRCPQAVYLRPRFPLYRDASRRVMAILAARADVLQQVGIDEAYLEATSRRTFEAARTLAKELQAEIFSSERLSASVGVGPNRLIAKLASDHRKPLGLTVVLPSRVQEFLDPKDVRALRGVGPVTRERLARLGFETVARLRGADERLLEREFGRFGAYLWREARGLDDSPVDPVWEQQSIGRETTFDRDTADGDVVTRTLEELVGEVQREMTNDGHWCRTLTVKIRFEGYETHSRQRTFKLATFSLSEMKAAARTLLTPFLASGRRFRLVGFSASKLVPPEDLLPLS
jgi:DNA polymerase IV (archaeal DinB-like DNA polymerase)